MKNYLLSILLLGAAGMSAQTMTEITTETDLLYFGGQQTFSLSPDGRYVCGATFAWSGFIYDIQEQKNILFDEESGASFVNSSVQLLDINDAGQAVGFDDNGGILVNAAGEYHVFAPYSSSYTMVLPHGVNADASVIVGAVADAAWKQHACYWENEELVMLPEMTEEETGFRVNGSCAVAISSDSNVIMGYIVDRQSTYPMVLWKRQSDGTYMLDPVFMENFEPNNVAQKDEEGNITGYERGDKPYLIFAPCALSPDGKTVVLQVVENREDAPLAYRAAYYDVPSGEIEVVTTPGPIEKFGYFEISGVSDSKIAVGYAGIFGEYTVPFLLFGETGENLSLPEAFPTLTELEEYQKNLDLGYPYLATDISADGKVITGYGVIEANNNLGAMAFVINTGYEYDEVEAVIGSERYPVAYYTLDGVRSSRPMRGINIVKYSDGSYEKWVRGSMK